MFVDRDPAVPAILAGHGYEQGGCRFWKVCDDGESSSPLRLPGPTADAQRCHRAALRVNRLAQLYRAQHKLKFVPPTIAQTIYTAGTSFLLAAAQAADATHAAAALAHCNEMLAMLREISETWHAAAQKALILEELVAEYQSSTDAPDPAAQLWTVPLARDHPNPSPTTLDHPWSASDATLDDFIQSLFSQNTMPLGSDVDLMALLQDGMGVGTGTG